MEPIRLDPSALESIIEAVVATAAAKIYQADQGGLAVARAWVYQRPEQVKQLGKDAPYYVGWIDPDRRRRSKSCGVGIEGRSSARKLKRQIEAELLTGTYGTRARAMWAEFRAQFEELELPGKSTRTRAEVMNAFAHFERLAKPGRVSGIDAVMLDRFKTRRAAEVSSQTGQLVSVATVNKELRHLRAALRKARKWKYTEAAPEVDFLREQQKLPDYMPPETFAAVYAACNRARLPRGLCIAYSAGDWWQALLVTIYLTGWRIQQVLSLRRADVNLETREVYSLAEHNKGRRDVKLVLHQAVIDHLRRVPGFGDTVFPWPHRRATLWQEFGRLQRLAGVKPERKARYGFHDLRRAFATMNADRLTVDALQRLMQHRDYQTTQRYIALARQLRPAADNLFVPDVLTVKVV